MMRSTRWGLAVGLLIAGLAFAEDPKQSKITIGLTDTLFRDNPDARSEKTAAPFLSLLESQTGLSGEVEPNLKPDELAQRLKDGKVKLAIFQGFEFAWARQKDHNFKPLMIAINQQPNLRALVLVRDNSAAASLADLKGKVIADPRRAREPCRLFLDRRCEALGKPPRVFFAKVLTPAAAEAAVDAVVNGQVDAAVTDSIFLSWYEKHKAARFAKLKVIEKSAVFPAIVVAYRAGALNDATLGRLRKGMLTAKDNPRGVELMTLCQMTSFEPVPDDYDKQLTEIAKAYPAPDKAKEKKPDYRVLARDKGHVAIVNAKGEVEWEVACNTDAHDISMLPNGNVLMPVSATKIVEMSPEKKVIWEHESKPAAGNKGRVEVHSFQRLADGATLIAESGNRRLIEVNKDGKIVREIPLTIDKPDPHRDTRLVRKLDNGHYLVCHEGDGKVREYDDKGKVVWSYTLDLAGRPRSPGHGPEGHGTEVFGAVRMPNGHTLIAGGNNNRVIEVDKDGKIVWSIGHDELPGIRLAWVTTLELLENGNVIVGNCHAGPNSPQLFEVTREKKVVWTFNNQKVFGNDVAAAQVLGVKGKVVR